ncbi:MAG: hypothetical protein ACOYZ8_05905 [Chloroflexota bacterium]
MKKGSNLSERGQGLVEYILQGILILTLILALFVILLGVLDDGQKVILFFGIFGILFLVGGSWKFIQHYFFSNIEHNMKAEREFVQRQNPPSNSTNTSVSKNETSQGSSKNLAVKRLEVLSYLAGIVSCLIAVITLMLSVVNK